MAAEATEHRKLKTFLKGLEQRRPREPAGGNNYNQPPLLEFEEQLLDDFFFLSGFRVSGFTESRISLSDIIAYCELEGIGDPIYCARMWQMLDQTMIDYHREQSEMQEEVKTQGTNSP